MSNSVEICNLLNEAAKSGVVVRIRYPGNGELNATVGQVGTGWVELATFNNLMHRDGEKWLKIALIEDVICPSASL